MKNQLILPWLFLGATLCACAQQESDDDESAAARLDVETAALGVEGVDALSSPDPVAAAAEAARPDARDAGCRTRRLDEASPNTVHVTLRDCSKRFGRHVISGELTLTFSAGSNGALHVERESSNLTVDGRPASHRASTDIVFDGELRIATTSGTWLRTREDGSSVTREGAHVVTLDKATRCRVAEGKSTELVDGVEVGTGASHVAWCELADGVDGCPVGEVERDRPARGKHVVTRFDGTSVATSEITGPRGTRTRQSSLVCSPAP